MRPLRFPAGRPAVTMPPHPLHPCFHGIDGLWTSQSIHQQVTSSRSVEAFLWGVPISFRESPGEPSR